MILAFSTSSPLASVALISRTGEVLASAEKLAQMAASSACLELLDSILQKSNCSLADVTVFVSDLGPGSFTGVKVAVTLVKTFAFVSKANCAGVTSFDLIDPKGTVVFPSKKGEWFVRRPGEEALRVSQLPQELFAGFGPGIEEPKYPHASMVSLQLSNLTEVEPEKLVPLYLIEPSISSPKRPLSPMQGPLNA